jgi:chromate transporter
MSETPRPAVPSFGEALAWWLKLGFLSFGGPAGRSRSCTTSWSSAGAGSRKALPARAQLLHAAARPEAQQLATYIGWLMHRTRGGIVAGALFVLPSLVDPDRAVVVYMAFGDVPAIAGAFYGIKPAVTAIVAVAAYRLGSRALTNAGCGDRRRAFVADLAFDCPFPLDRAWRRRRSASSAAYRPGQVHAARGHGRRDVVRARGDRRRHADATARGLQPRPLCARLRRLPHPLGRRARRARRLLRKRLGAGEDAGFFTQAALLTFGGAYAVLPYVFQGAVEQTTG